jgi:hypothetical protein
VQVLVDGLDAARFLVLLLLLRRRLRRTKLTMVSIRQSLKEKKNLHRVRSLSPTEQPSASVWLVSPGMPAELL